MLNQKSFSVIDQDRIHGNIHIVGCGAIGSKAGAELLRLNLASKIIAYDYDVVEEKNLNNQAYFRQHIGMNKVDALKDLGTMIDSDAVIRTKNKKVDYIRTKTSDIVIIGLDNFVGRASILNNIEGNPLVIIGAANSVGGNVEVIRGDYKKYGAEYAAMPTDTPEYSPEDTTACGSPISISHRLSGIATIMAEQILENMDTEEDLYKNIIYDVTLGFIVTQD
jgi:molybdopterin/thiamine biosynthesis adenylyltransferase